MTVAVLRLTGMPTDQAAAAAAEMLDDPGKHPDLGKLLVIDDTALLVEHAPVYGQLLSARFRVGTLLCVTVGPRERVGHEDKLLIPANLGGEEHPVLWVGDLSGVDWRLGEGEIATGHASYSGRSGLDELVYLLSFDDVFDQVREAGKQLPDGVASPGLRLAGSDDEATSFAGALAIAIGRLGADGRSVPVQGDEPLPLSGTGPADGVGLVPDGELARLRDAVNTSVSAASAEARQLGRIGGLLGIGGLDPAARVREVGAALAALRTRVARLLTEVGTPGGLPGRQLTVQQRQLVTDAGVLLPKPALAVIKGGGAAWDRADGGGENPGDQASSPVFDAIIETVRRGETLPQATERLSVTERTLLRGMQAGSQNPTEACPDELLLALAAPPPPPRPGRRVQLAVLVALAVIAVPAAFRSGLHGLAPLGGGILVAVAVIVAAVWNWKARVAAWRNGLALRAARQAATDLTDLVLAVAASQWSGGGTMLDEVTRARNTLDGLVKELAKHAVAPPDPGAGQDVVPASRQAEVLLPYLRALVTGVLTAMAAETMVNGEPALQLAQATTADLLRQWADAARQHGALARPPFAPETVKAVTEGGRDGELKLVTTLVQYEPAKTMWQLCRHQDLDALDLSGRPQVVTFAPLRSRDALGSVLPKETVWLPVEQYAGLLRLVPLLPVSRHRSWVSDETSPEALA